MSRTDPIVTLRMPADELAAMDAAAAEAGLSRAAWFTQAARAQLATSNKQRADSEQRLASIERRLAELERRTGTQAQPARPQPRQGIMRSATAAAQPEAATQQDSKPARATSRRTTARSSRQTAPEALAMLFDMHEDGSTHGEIAEALNAAGYTTATGAQWDNVKVKHLIHNRRRPPDERRKK